MRVAHLLRVVDSKGAGVQTYMASVAAALTGSDWSLTVAGYGPGRAPAYPVDELYMGTPSGKGRNAIEFWRWLRHNLGRMDVVHIHNVFGLPLLLGAIACLRCGTPYVVSPHGRLMGPALAEMGWRHRLYLRLIALPLMRRARAVIVTMESELGVLHQLDPRLRTVAVQPSLAAAPADQASAPEGEGLRVVFVGRIVAVKNLPLLVQAIARLRQDGVAVSLDLVGPEPDGHGAELRARVEHLKLEPWVCFHGPRFGADRDAIVRRAHVAAMPSFRENFSFAAAEAMALGVPVVVSTEVGLVPLVERYGCGAVVAPTDVEAWAAALQGYLDPVLRQDHARRALDCVRRELTPASMRNALTGVYRSAMARSGPRKVS